MANKVYYYSIYMGSDVGGSKPPVDDYVDGSFDFDEAYANYQLVKKECFARSNQKGCETMRFYCYMTQANYHTNIMGRKDGKDINYHCFSQTIYSNSYTQSPEYYEDVKEINRGPCK